MAIVTRVTQGLLAQRTLNNLNIQFNRIAGFQEQLATGLRVNRPSDDPIDARRAMNLRTLISKNDQFLSNIGNISPQLEESATTLLGVVDILQRALELTTQAANETVDQPQLDQIALEIDQLLESLVVAGNRRTNGRSIFAGTQTIADAFDITRVGDQIVGVTYAGNEETIEVTISEGSRTGINVSGTDAFQSNVDVFAVLIGIRDDLTPVGDQDNLREVRLGELQTALDQTLFAVARVGSIQNRLERVTNELLDFNLQFEVLLSDKIDADFAETVLGLDIAENALIAALSAAGRVLQPSLLDFVR